MPWLPPPYPTQCIASVTVRFDYGTLLPPCTPTGAMPCVSSLVESAPGNAAHSPCFVVVHVLDLAALYVSLSQLGLLTSPFNVQFHATPLSNSSGPSHTPILSSASG